MVLPSTAPEVGSALSLQKSQSVLDKEEEKKTLMKKMMVRKQLKAPSRFNSCVGYTNAKSTLSGAFLMHWWNRRELNPCPKTS